MSEVVEVDAAMTAAATSEPAAQGEVTSSNDDMSDADRIQYLRDRGVTVDLSPSERKKAPVADPAPVGALVPLCTYVRIPSNEREPYEELVAMVPLNPDGSKPVGDKLPGLLKPCFADRSKGINEQVLAEHARAQLGGQAASVSSRAFSQATLDGSVETFALVRPSTPNDNCGVYMYLDEVGVLKDLPPNPRANALAAACGHAAVSFHGDIFVGRLATKPPPMHNVDFKLADLDSGNKWIKTAPAENYEYSLGMKEVEKALNSKGNSQHIKLGGFDEGEMPRGEDPNGAYAWTQTKAEVEVVVPLPVGTKAKELTVSMKRAALHVRLGPSVLLDVPALNAHINAEDSSWSLDGGKLVFTLEKARASTWRMLKADGQEGE